MSDSPKAVEDAWKDAEALIHQVDQAARNPGDDFYSSFVDQWAAATKASGAAIWVAEAGEIKTLARCGVDLWPGEGDATLEIASKASGSPTAQWAPIASANTASADPSAPGRASDSGERLITVKRLDRDWVVGLTGRFDHWTELPSRRPIQEMTEVLLDLVCGAYLTKQCVSLKQAVGTQRDRDELISALYGGVGLRDSAAAITSAVAAHGSVDRVSLLRFRGERSELIATSTQPRVDRRARQSRLMERLADEVAQGHGKASFVVGNPNSDDVKLTSLEDFLQESGSRAIYVETVTDGEAENVAVLVCEQFRLDAEDDDSVAKRIDGIHEPVRAAILNAMQRDDAGWSILVDRVSRSGRRRAGWIATGLVLAVIALAVIPVPLWIPADGTVRAAQTRRVFAPTEGIVVDVLIENGDRVEAGQPLFQLRSGPLELQREQLMGDLDTARTQLAALGALRTQDDAARRRTSDSRRTGSADEQALRTRISGLRSQLVLLEKQFKDLKVLSPISGHVDRWNLSNSVKSRPVIHGQYLADIISTENGWRIELELPDKHAGYLLSHQRHEPSRCSFQLSSGQQRVFEGTVEEVADTTELTATGKSILRVIVPYPPTDTDDFRVGATVGAKIHCGNRSLGFVLFRGAFEWLRQQAWI